MEEVFLKKAEMWRTNLGRARLVYADLSEADLNGADLSEADLSEANLSEAKLNGADLRWANLSWGYLREANLSDANLVGAQFVETDLTHADLTGCRIYGISVWNVQLEGTIQDNLIITNYDEPEITVDNLEVAQFIYLLLNNKKIRNVIDTIAKKVVLILGRFTPERKRVLDALRDKLREHNYSPVVFDFDPPESQDLTETVSTLAHLARFVIVDLTDPSSAPHEMATIAPQCIRPIKPIISNELVLKDGKEVEKWREYAMFQSLRKRYHWILDTFRYQDIPHLIDSLQDDIIKPVEEKITHWEPEKEKIKEQEEEIRKQKEENKKLREELEKLRRGR